MMSSKERGSTCIARATAAALAHLYCSCTLGLVPLPPMSPAQAMGMGVLLLLPPPRSQCGLPSGRANSLCSRCPVWGPAAALTFSFPPAVSLAQSLAQRPALENRARPFQAHMSTECVSSSQVAGPCLSQQQAVAHLFWWPSHPPPVESSTTVGPRARHLQQHDQLGCGQCLCVQLGSMPADSLLLTWRRSGGLWWLALSLGQPQLLEQPLQARLARPLCGSRHFCACRR